MVFLDFFGRQKRITNKKPIIQKVYIAFAMLQYITSMHRNLLMSKLEMHIQIFPLSKSNVSKKLMNRFNSFMMMVLQ